MSEREDGFYFVRFEEFDGPAEWDGKQWFLPGYIGAPLKDQDLDEIGPRVQRDSEVVRQGDELLAALKESNRRVEWFYDQYSGMGADIVAEHSKLIARIESQKSGVKP